MSDFDKIGLFLVIVGLGLLAGKASAKLAREAGVPTLAISIVAAIMGHGLSGALWPHPVPIAGRKRSSRVALAVARAAAKQHRARFGSENMSDHRCNRRSVGVAV